MLRRFTAVAPFLLLSVAIVAALGALDLGASASAKDNVLATSATGDYLVGFVESVNGDEARAIAGQVDIESAKWIASIHTLAVRPEAEHLGALGELAGDPSVVYVEPDAFAVVQHVPNDLRYPTHQWAPQLSGAETAWELTTGSPFVVAGIVDSGLDMTHEDMAGKFTAGYDFVNDDSDPSDDNGHGTQVACIVGAATHNGLGVAAVGYDTAIMPVKVVNASGRATYSDLSDGIVWAANNGAQVITVSVGGYVNLSTLRNAVAYADGLGVFIVGASGNINSSAPFYPAAYPQVMGVTATTQSDARWPYSGYGSWLSVAAPGASIQTTNWPGNGGGLYISAGGTSLAAPHVTAMAALMPTNTPTATATATPLPTNTPTATASPTATTEPTCVVVQTDKLLGKDSYIKEDNTGENKGGSSDLQL